MHHGPDVLHPLDVAARLRRRVDPDAPVAHDRDRRRGELVHAHEPLQRDQRLDALARALAERDGVGVELGVADQALVAQRGDDALLRLVDAQARVLARRPRSCGRPRR